MRGDTSPLSRQWAKPPRPARAAPPTFPRADYAALAAQLAEELDYVAAGQLAARLVLCRYSHRQLLGAMREWGFDSARSRQLDAMRRIPENWPGPAAAHGRTTR